MKSIPLLLIAYLFFISRAFPNSKLSLSNERLNENPSAMLVETSIERIFVPKFGFDDNDNIEIEITGTLPNSCFTLGKFQFERIDGGRLIELKQYLWKETNGICQSEAMLPEYSKIPIPFHYTGSLGRLSAGEYLLEYKKTENEFERRPLEIKKAPANTVNSVPYAEITEISVKDFWSPTDVIQIQLSGFLSTACLDLQANIDIQQQGDVFVIQPITQYLNWIRCTPLLKSFSIPLKLGRVSRGTFLIHVRSRSGSALNRLIYVR